MRPPRVTEDLFVRDALVLVLVALISATAAVRLGIRELPFQVMFVIVCGSLAARRLMAHRQHVQPVAIAHDVPSAMTMLAALSATALWLASDHPTHSLAMTTIVLPSSARWCGFALGLAFVAEPAFRPAALRRTSVEDSTALLPLLLLSANWGVALLACVSVPLALVAGPGWMSRR